MKKLTALFLALVLVLGLVLLNEMVKSGELREAEL